MLTPEPLSPAYIAVNDWLRSQTARPLIVTHARPDGDAIGSTVALGLVLQELGHHPRIYFDRELFPPQLNPFVPQDLLLEDTDLAAFDAVICLDCAAPDRLGLPVAKAVEDIPLPCCNIDHHPSNGGFGAVDLVDPDAAATAEILARLFEGCGLPLPPAAATALLAGITQDTGCFRFNNTSPEVLQATAWLMRRGGDYQRIMDELYFNTPLRLLRLQARAIETTKLALDGRLAYFFVTDELLETCGCTAAEADDLIDVVRTIAGVEITCRMQQVDNDVRFSLRSQNPDKPILPLARRIGGGGHALAAGATMKNATLAEAEAELLQLAEELLHG